MYASLRSNSNGKTPPLLMSEAQGNGRDVPIQFA